jgi:hypothetical protein
MIFPQMTIINNEQKAQHNYLTVLESKKNRQGLGTWLK